MAAEKSEAEEGETSEIELPFHQTTDGKRWLGVAAGFGFALFTKCASDLIGTLKEVNRDRDKGFPFGARTEEVRHAHDQVADFFKVREYIGRRGPGFPEPPIPQDLPRSFGILDQRERRGKLRWRGVLAAAGLVLMAPTAGPYLKKLYDKIMESKW